MISMLMNLGMILLFLSILPQLVRSYKRRQILKDYSSLHLVMQMSAGIIYLIIYIMTKAIIATILELFIISYITVTLYWLNSNRD